MYTRINFTPAAASCRIATTRKMQGHVQDAPAFLDHTIPLESTIKPTSNGFEWHVVT